MTIDQFPQPRPLPRQYRVDMPDTRAELDRSWMADGLCTQADPEAFFPNKGDSPKAAKKVCADCPVRAQCLAWSLANDEHFGVWGGLTEHDRRKMRAARNRAAA